MYGIQNLGYFYHVFEPTEHYTKWVISFKLKYICNKKPKEFISFFFNLDKGFFDRETNVFECILMLLAI